MVSNSQHSLWYCWSWRCWCHSCHCHTDTVVLGNLRIGSIAANSARLCVAVLVKSRSQQGPRGSRWWPCFPLWTKWPLRPRQDDISRCIFYEKCWISIKRWLKFFPRNSNKNKRALFQIMAWHRTDDKPLSEPMVSWFTGEYLCQSALMS